MTGLVVGGLLDPLGQREAERSVHGAASPGAGDSGGQPVVNGAGRAPLAAPAPPGWAPAPLGTSAPHWSPAVSSPAAAHRFGAHLVLVPYCVFFAVLVVVSTTDLSHGVIPRRLVYPALGASRWSSWSWSRRPTRSGTGWATPRVGAAAAFAVLFVIWWLAPRGMGFGDVRLSALIGLATGWIGLLATYVALASAFIVGLAHSASPSWVCRASGRTVRIPFAPALAVGAIVAVFWGAPIVQAVFHRTL